MRYVARSDAIRLASVLGVLAFAALGAGCGSPPGHSFSAEPSAAPQSSQPLQGSQPPGSQPPQPPQKLFKVDLLADVSALDSGVLGYQAPTTMQTGAEETVVVEVTDIGKGKPGTAPLPSGFVYGRQDVPTGGIVGVHASCRDVTCDPNAPERQPVLAPGMTGEWSWTLSERSPGTADVVLVATTYDQNTDIPLHVTKAIHITITVTAAPGYWVSKVGSWTKAVLGFVGFAAIVGAVQWLWRHRWKRNGDTPADPKEPAEPAESP